VAFVDGATAAAIGTIAGAVFVLGKRSITDVPTLALMLFTILLLWRVKKLTEPVIVAAAAVVGLIVFPMIKA
jgi:chromate transporter